MMDYGKDPVSNVLLPTWRHNELIVFSEENKDYYIKNNYDPKKIRVIPNRIELNNSEDSVKFLKVNDNKADIVFLIISRLDWTKVKSILTTFRIVEDLVSNSKKLQLIIAGGGNCEGMIREEAMKINEKLGGEFIKVLGHIDDIQNLILKSHVVFGKG